MTSASAATTASTATNNPPTTEPQKPSDSIAGAPPTQDSELRTQGSSLPTRNSKPGGGGETGNSKRSLRPLFEQLSNASTSLDEMLQDLDLSKEETEQLVASQKFHSHRQLRTQLLAQQLQLAAQDHARHALNKLLQLTDSNHAAIARLAATQILAYAGLTPPKNTPQSIHPRSPTPNPTLNPIPLPVPLSTNSQFCILNSELPTPPTRNSKLETRNSSPHRFPTLTTLLALTLLPLALLHLARPLAPAADPTYPHQSTLTSESPMPGYNPAQIEKKWQQFWAENKTFATDTSDHNRPKYYALDMFPYPSGQGLHVGHPEGYTATDIVSRYKRAKGCNVMHPMGWDAFGLPAEQYAIKNNVHPAETTANNIHRFRKQLQSLGFSYDWDREVDTTDPKYYQWTQWIFLQLYDTWFDESQQKGRPIAELAAEFASGKRPLPGAPAGSNRSWQSLTAAEQRAILSYYRLAYEAEVPVNWCQGLGTVLANEEVIDGKSEVGGFPVERRPMRQWMLRITAYAQRLLAGLDKLEWSDSLKEMQRNWIGQSEGAEVTFQIADRKGAITVFTTRPDTLYGATYMVIAPEHPMANSASRLKTPQAAEIQKYQKYAASRSDRERQEDTTKTGAFTGLYAINPVNDAKIPIWVSDYVLMGYGTGAIMAVPAHDERDHEFATKFNLPIIQVVGGPADIDVQAAAFVEEGVAVNSPWIDGLPTQEAKTKITAILEEKGIGKKTINYKLRDWLFSRQRYWGEPFPIVHLPDGTHVRLADSELPLTLPELEDFKPTGTIDPPLSKAKDWVNIHVVLDGDRARLASADTAGAVRARRELNTMPQWAGSCWYYLRYLDPKNATRFVEPAIEKYWLGPDSQDSGLRTQNSVGGVDLYIGGVEHAVLHLLYSRFWHKVLFDRGFVSTDEPFRKLVNQGLILGEDSQKMSKSRGNVVNPDDVVRDYGADSLRMFEMFMGPLEQVKPWSTAGVEGVYRFLQRVWRNLFDENDNPKLQPAGGEDPMQRPLHRMIKKVGDDIERLAFNTAISAMMEFNNALAKSPAITRETATTFLRVLEPFAPHFAEEAYERLGGKGSITQLPWPAYDPALLIDASIEIPVQVNGKLRGRITVASNADEATILGAALGDAEVRKHLAGKEPKKKIYVKGRMVNLVV